MVNLIVSLTEFGSLDISVRFPEKSMEMIREEITMNVGSTKLPVVSPN